MYYWEIMHFDLNKRQRIKKGKSKMDTADKLVTSSTQDEDKQSKNTTQYVLDTTIRKQTLNK